MRCGWFAAQALSSRPVIAKPLTLYALMVSAITEHVDRAAAVARANRLVLRRWKRITLQVLHAAVDFGLGNRNLAVLYATFGIDFGNIEALDEDGCPASDIPLLVSDTSSDDAPPTGPVLLEPASSPLSSSDSEALGDSE